MPPVTRAVILFCWGVYRRWMASGPAELGLEELAERLKDHPPGEMIIATNPTVEGEATAFYLQRMAQKHDIAISRIAHGVPLGGELEFTDQSTIAHAFASRQKV